MIESTETSETVLETARDFGARDAYRMFPSWNDDLEHRIMADWAAVFGGRDWLLVREAVIEGWEAMHSIVAPGEPVVPQQH
jgi:hypothetical protein